MAHGYTFDVKLFASIYVSANSEAEARAMLADKFRWGSEANLGAWPNGNPILATVCGDETANDELIEIDGEAV